MKAPVHDALRLRLPTRRARVLIGIVLTCFGALSARNVRHPASQGSGRRFCV